MIHNDKLKITVDAGDIAPKYISGHGHCDALSFELYYDGIPVIVNSGTHQYQTKYRKYFRGTSAHNTLCIDGGEQSEIWGEHRTGRQSKVISGNIARQSFLLR